MAARSGSTTQRSHASCSTRAAPGLHRATPPEEHSFESTGKDDGRETAARACPRRSSEREAGSSRSRQGRGAVTAPRQRRRRRPCRHPARPAAAAGLAARRVVGSCRANRARPRPTPDENSLRCVDAGDAGGAGGVPLEAGAAGRVRRHSSGLHDPAVGRARVGVVAKPAGSSLSSCCRARITASSDAPPSDDWPSQRSPQCQARAQPRGLPSRTRPSGRPSAPPTAAPRVSPAAAAHFCYETRRMPPWLPPLHVDTRFAPLLACAPEPIAEAFRRADGDTLLRATAGDP